MSSKLEFTCISLILKSLPKIILYRKHSLDKTVISELNIVDYNVFCNNISSAHRGVCIYIKSCLDAYLDDTLYLTEFSESIWCKIPLAGGGLMIIGAVY